MSVGNSEALKYQVKKQNKTQHYKPQIGFWFWLDLVSDEEISRFLFYPNQFPTNYRLIPSLLRKIKTEFNFKSRRQLFQLENIDAIVVLFLALSPADARGFACHLFCLPSKNKRNSVPGDFAQPTPDVTDFVVMLQAPLTPL